MKDTVARVVCPQDPAHYLDSHAPGGAWFGHGHDGQPSPWSPGVATERPGRRVLTLRFEVDEDCALSDGELEELGDRIVATQIDPDPPVLTFDGVEIVRAEAGKRTDVLARVRTIACAELSPRTAELVCGILDDVSEESSR